MRSLSTGSMCPEGRDRAATVLHAVSRGAPILRAYYANPFAKMMSSWTRASTLLVPALDVVGPPAMIGVRAARRR